MKGITAVLVALAMAAPAAAQTIIPGEGPATTDEEGTFSGDAARKVMDQFAACVLDRKRKIVLDALAMPPDSPEQNNEFRYLSKIECIAAAELHFNGPAFRGSLYKALVRKKFGRKEVFPVAANSETSPDTNVPSRLNEAGLLTFASCVIHKDPTNARTAILATAGSPNERDAVAALAGVYGQCLYADDKLRLPKGRLLELLAEAYYRDANALIESPTAK